MIKSDLREFIEAVTRNGFISDDDVGTLRREILRDGISSRIEVEALIALDRSVEAAGNWRSVLTELVVAFTVWGRAPEGSVSSDDALWLSTVLEVGGPTGTAMDIAYAILDEASYVDAALLDFIMRGRQLSRLSQMAA